MPAHIGVIEKLSATTDQVIGPLADPKNGYALLDFPNYSNVGDSLIWLGELAFFDRLARGRQADYVCTARDFDAEALRRAAPSGPIYLSGGGNFGDIWPHFQDFREAVIDAFPDRTVIQLPQTIHYGASGSRLFQSQRCIARHPNFTLLVRDRKSLAFAENNFDCHVALSPDMAFNIGEVGRPSAPEYDMMCLMRTDKEVASERGTVNASDPAICITDWIEEKKPTLAERVSNKLNKLGFSSTRQASFKAYKRVAEGQMKRGMGILSKGHVVITDRLHGHILSTLMRIPHVVLDNSYGKVSGFMDEWTNADPVVHRATTFEEALEVASQINAKMAAEA